MGKNISLVLVLIGFWMTGCHSDRGDLERIDYERLSPIEINLAMEFAESKHYLPGELRDLVLTSDGTLLVSDWGKVSIEQISAKGKHMATIAEAGRGPGEVPEFFLLQDTGNDTLIVRHRGMSGQIDVFGPGADGIYRHIRSRAPEESRNRYTTVLGNRSDSEYYATSSWTSRDMQEMRSDQKEYNQTPLVVVNRSEEILQDSLHLLKTPRPLIEYGERSMNILGMPPYQTQDRFSLRDDGRYVIGRPDSSTLYIYNSDHEIERKIRLKVQERPVRNSDLDYYYEQVNADREVQRKMEERVPEHKPPFLNMWTSVNYIWLSVDTNEKGNQIVVFDMEGEPAGTFYLSEYDDIRYFRDGRIYTLHKHPEAGHSIPAGLLNIFCINFYNKSI